SWLRAGVVDLGVRQLVREPGRRRGAVDAAVLEQVVTERLAVGAGDHDADLRIGVDECSAGLLHRRGGVAGNRRCLVEDDVGLCASCRPPTAPIVTIRPASRSAGAAPMRRLWMELPLLQTVVGARL